MAKDYSTVKVVGCSIFILAFIIGLIVLMVAHYWLYIKGE